MWVQRIAIVITTLLLASACKETTDCANIRTGGVAMLTEVVAKSDSNVVGTTELRVGGDESNTFCILSGGDELVVEADGKSKRMEAIDDGVYEAKFSAGEGDTKYTVRLMRSEADEDALDNSGKLPPPFDVTSDFPDPISRMDDDMEITWSPADSGDDMEIAFDDKIGGCIFDDDFDIPGDDGSYVLEADSLDSSSSQDPESCDVTATLTRTRKGSTDSILDSESRFELRQERSFTFTSDP